MNISFKELHNESLKLIPKKSGVYWVIMPEDFKMLINETTDGRKTRNGKNMIYPVEDLKKRAIHYNLPDRGGNILYIGKAQNLYNRIKQYMIWGYYQTDFVKSSPHAGGRAIWQLADNKDLLIAYSENPNPEKEEARLIDEYFIKYGCLPFANRQRGLKKYRLF